MGKLKSKLSILSLMFMWAIVLIAGCGNPYKNLRLSLDNKFVNVDGQYTYEVDLVNNQPTTFSFDVTVNGLKKGVSSDVIIESKQPDKVQILKTTKNGNTTTTQFEAKQVGQSYITIRTKEGNVSQTVLVKINVPIENFVFAQMSSFAIERGSQFDLQPYVTYTPNQTNQTDLDFSIVSSDKPEEQDKISFDGNKISVAGDSTISQFVLAVHSNYNDSIETKQITINVIDVIDESHVVLKYKQDQEYVELEKNNKGQFILSVAQNSQDENAFSKHLYMFYRENLDDISHDVFFNTLSNYTYGIVVDNGFTNNLSNAYIDVTKFEEHFVVMEQGMGDAVFQLGYSNAQLTGNAIRTIDVQVVVEYYPQVISVTNNRIELGSDVPMSIYDDDKVGGTSNAIDVYIQTSSGVNLTRSPFYIRIKGQQHANYRVELYNLQGVVDENATYTANDGPFYIIHDYPDAEAIGAFTLEIVSAVPQIELFKSIPLEFVRGQMDIDTVEDAYSVNVDGNVEDGENTQTILFRGIDTSSLWDRIQVVGMNTELVSYAWTENHEAIVVTANSEGKTGKFDVRFVAPNNNSCTVSINVFHELKSAELIVGNAVASNPSIVAIEDNPDAHVTSFEFLAGTVVPMQYVLNGVIDENLLDRSVRVSVASQEGNGVTFHADATYFTVNNNASVTTITMLIEGYNSVGTQYGVQKTFTFVVKPVLPITEVSLNDIDNDNIYEIYSRVDLQSLNDDSKKIATIRYTIRPNNLAHQNPVWVLTDSTGVKLKELHYNTDETMGVSYIYDGDKITGKVYTIEHRGNKIYAELNLANTSYISVYADLSNMTTNLYSFNVNIILTQSYQDLNRTRTYLTNSDAYATVQVARPTRVSSIRFEDLQKENDQFIYNFDIRDMELDGKNRFTSGNTAQILTTLAPQNAVNNNIIVKAELYEKGENSDSYSIVENKGADYLTTSVATYNNRDYQKEISVELIKPLMDQEGIADRYILVTVYAQDSMTVGSEYSVYNTFMVRLLDGSENNPFRIRNASDLDEMRNGLSSHYVLINNIDLSNYIANTEQKSWLAIGTSQTPFTGSLTSLLTTENSEPYTISGLTILENSTQGNLQKGEAFDTAGEIENYYIGLFGYLGNGAKVTNMNIRVGSINVIQSVSDSNSNQLYMGVVAGFNADAEISGVSVYDNKGAGNQATSSSIYFASNNPVVAHIGGLVGYNRGTIKYSQLETHTLRNTVNLVMEIKDNSSTGSATITYVGGMVGTNVGNGKIQSINLDTLGLGFEAYDVVVDILASQMTNNSSVIGGVVGNNKAMIDTLQVMATINGYQNIGGVAGLMTNGTLNNLTVAPILRGDGNVGGLIGDVNFGANSNITNNKVEFYQRNFASSKENSSIIANTNIGAFIGYVESNLGAEQFVNNSAYSYVKSTLTKYNLTDQNVFWGDILITGNSGAGASMFGNVSNMVDTIIVDNVFVKVNMQATTDTAKLSGFANFEVENPDRILTIQNTHFNLTTLVEMTNAFSGVTPTNSYAIVNGKFVGYDASAGYYDNYNAWITELADSVYAFDATNGNTFTGLNSDNTDEDYLAAVYYAHEDYEIKIGEDEYPYLINLAGIEQRKASPTVALLVNLPPLSVTCELADETTKPYLEMVRLVDSAYDANGNIIVDKDGTLKGLLADANRIQLNKVLRANAVPAFLSNTKVNITSSNTKVLSIVNISGTNYLQLNGVGQSTITITSLYDEDVQASLTLDVIDRIAGFGLYEDDEFKNSIITTDETSANTLEVVKGTAQDVYADVINVWESIETKYNTVTGVKLYSDEANAGEITINAKDASEIMVNGETQQGWDIQNLQNISINGTKAGTVKLKMVPYILINGIAYDLTGKTCEFSVEVINGTQDVNIEGQKTSLSFIPSNTTQTFSVTITTDKENETLYMVYTDQNGEDRALAVDSNTESTDRDYVLGDMVLTIQDIKHEENLITYVFGVKANTANIKADHAYGTLTETEILKSFDCAQEYTFTFYVVKNASIKINENTKDDAIKEVTSVEEVIENCNPNVTRYPSLKVIMEAEPYEYGSVSVYHYPNNLTTIRYTYQKTSDTEIDPTKTYYTEKNAAENQYEAVVVPNKNNLTSYHERTESYEFSGQEIPYDNIIAGNYGFLKLELAPKYTNIQKIEITSTSLDGQYIRFDQMVKEYTNNTPSYHVLENADNSYMDGINPSKTSVVADSRQYFNGEYYIRTLVPSSVTDGGTYTVTIKLYAGNGDATYTLVDTLTKDLTVLVPPAVSISCEKTAIARGTTQNFTLVIRGKDSTTTIPDFSKSSVSTATATYTKGNYWSIQSLGNDTYQLWVSNAVPSGAVVNIVYEVTKTINGNTFVDTNEDHPLQLTVADFVINSIAVENVYNGKFVGQLNLYYQLKIRLDDVSYDPHTIGVVSKIEALEAELSNLRATGGVTSTWWVVENGEDSNLTNRPYAGFDATVNSNDGTVRVKNTVLNTNATLKAKVFITYGAEVDALAYDNITSASAVSEYVLSFGFDCYRYTDEENPTPIYNTEQFIEMLDDGVGDYRLMTDITLENWTPRDTYRSTTDINSGSTITQVITSIDGNGYVVEIKDFNTESLAETGIGGLFGTVHEDTIIKNLTVLLRPTTKDATIEIDKESSGPTIASNEKFDIEVDMQGATEVYFGTVAGVNNGMITNTSVVYNADALKDTRITKLLSYTNPNVEVPSAEDLLSYEENELYKQYSTTLKDSNEYYFYRKKSGVVNFYDDVYDGTATGARTLTSIHIQSDLGVSAYVGGFVGQNNGYITNSHVESISIKGSGYVAGFVAENTNKISSSYYRDGNIKNDFNTNEDAGTAGLVVLNSGEIAYSYVEGRSDYKTIYEDDADAINSTITAVENKNVTSITSSDFTGHNYENLIGQEQWASSMRYRYSGINSNIHAAGFVFENSGKITNSYANILVNSTNDSAGFVYINAEEGYISDVYSLSSVKVNQGNASQFSGRTGVNNYLNQGTIEHSVYLKAEGDIVDPTNTSKTITITDEVTDDKFVDSISLTQFSRYSSFTGFAFNQDYQTNSEEEMGSAVWFIPGVDDYAKNTSATEDDVTGYNILQKEYYMPKRPQLVSANMLTLSMNYLQSATTDSEGNTTYSYQPVAGVEGEITNPYLIYDAQLFDTRMNDRASINSGSVEALTYNTRLIRDFSYAEKSDRKATTYETTYSGVLEGNNMTIQNLNITAEKDSDKANASEVKYAGLFGMLNSATIKNLNIEVEEVSATGVPFVGILTGVVKNSNIYNVTLRPSSTNTYINGGNIIGGLAGVVYGNSQIVNITSSVSITSYFKSGSNEFNFQDKYSEKGVYTLLDVVTSAKPALKGVAPQTNTDTSTDYTTIYSNYDKVSYVGGIVGVMDANYNEIDAESVTEAQLAQARRLSVDDTVQLAGETVGGVMGYMGADVVSVNDEIRVADQSSMALIASRVAGGLIGENHGTLQRSFVAHEETLQDTIDEEQKDGAYSESNYRNLFGTSTDGQGTSRNAHYIGGLVGLSIGGKIENSYNRLPVYSLNALASGGLVGLSFGGSISASYTTASIRANESAGGLVGRMGNFNQSATDMQKYYFMKLGTQPITIQNVITTFDGGVAATVWNEEDLNAKLYSNKQLNPYYNLGAYIGYVDISEFDNDAIVKTVENMNASTYARAKRETNYAKKQTLSYVTNTAQAQSMVLSENGYTVDNRGAGLIDATAGSTSTRLLSINGGVYESVNGAESYYLYRDLGVFASLRTQEEFIARRLLWENDNISWSGKTFAGSEDTIDTQTYVNELTKTTESIYYSFMDMYWNGTVLNENLTPKDEEYLYPELKAETYDLIVYVREEEDLKKLDVYKDATFILMNDIYLTADWTPACQDKPFTGTIESNGTANYTIYDLGFSASSVGYDASDDSNLRNVGLIAKVKRATFKNFNISLKSSITLKAEANLKHGLNYGTLVGYVEENSRATIFQNISIYGNATKDNEGNVTVEGSTLKFERLNTFGGLVGVGTNMQFVTVTVQGLEVEITDFYKDTTFATPTYQQHAIGGIVGLVVDTAGHPVIIEACSSNSNEFTLGNSDTTNNYSTISTGGVVGALVGYDLKTALELAGESEVIANESTPATIDEKVDSTPTTVQNDILSMSSNDFAIVDSDSLDTMSLDIYYGGLIGQLTSTSDIYVGDHAKTSPAIIDNMNVEGVSITSQTKNANIGGLVGYQSTMTTSGATIKYMVTANQLDAVTINTSGVTDSIVGGLFGTLSGGSIEGEGNAKYFGETFTITSEKDTDATIGGLVGSFVGGSGTYAGFIQKIGLNSSESNQSFNYDFNESQITNFGLLVGKTSGGKISNIHMDNQPNFYNWNQASLANYGLIGTLDGTYADTITITPSFSITATNSGALAGLAKLGSVTISNVTISGTYVGETVGGLIGQLADSSTEATINNIQASNLTINSEGHAGGLIGFMTGGSQIIITNVSIAGAIGSSDTMKTDNAGGLIARIDHTTKLTISNIEIDATIVAGISVGGLFGCMPDSVSTDSSVNRVLIKGSVSGGSEMAGVVSTLPSGMTMNQVIAENNVLGSKYNSAGGFVGINKGTITNSYSQGYIDIEGRESDFNYLGAFVGLNEGTINNVYTISRYVYGTNYSAYYNENKGGFVGTNTGTLTNVFYVTDITPYSNNAVTTVKYITEFAEQDTENSIFNSVVNDWVSITTKLTKIIGTDTEDGTLDNIGTANVTNVGRTGLLISKTPSVTSNAGVIFGGKNGGSSLSVGTNTGIIDYFRLNTTTDPITTSNSGLLNRISVIGATSLGGSNQTDAEIRECQIFAKDAEFTKDSTATKYNTVYAKHTDGKTESAVFYNADGTESSVLSYQICDYSIGSFENKWIMIRTSNTVNGTDDITRRTLNYGYPVLRWTLQDDYRVASDGRLKDEYYWKSTDDVVTAIQGETVDDVVIAIQVGTVEYDIDLGNKLWTPLNGENTTLIGNLWNIKDDEIDTTKIDTFGNNYKSERGQTLNRIYNMTVYNQTNMLYGQSSTLSNVGLFQTLVSANNIRMENALVCNNHAVSGHTTGTVAGRLTGNSERLASINSAVYVNSGYAGGVVGSNDSTLTYAYNIYTEKGNSTDETYKRSTYGSLSGEIVGLNDGVISQIYSPGWVDDKPNDDGSTDGENDLYLIGESTPESSVSSNFMASGFDDILETLKTDVLEGFNWSIWSRANNATWYRNLPYIDGDIPFWIDGVTGSNGSYQYTEGGTTHTLTLSTNADGGDVEIANAHQLAMLAYAVNVDGLSIVDNINLTNSDIDLGGKLWTPIGTSENPFDGSASIDSGLDNAVTIKNMTVRRIHTSRDDSHFSGLFGYIKNASLAYINITDSSVFLTDNNSLHSQVGALVGYAGNSTIKGCHVSNTIIYTNGYGIGGLVGYAYNTTITETSVSGTTVKGIGDIGGVVGRIDSGTLETSYVNTVTIGNVAQSVVPTTQTASVQNVSALLAYNNFTTITNGYIGGLIGMLNEANALENVVYNVKFNLNNKNNGNVGGAFGYFKYTTTTKSMTTGVRNIYIHSTSLTTPSKYIYGVNDNGSTLGLHDGMSMILTNQSGLNLNTTYQFGSINSSSSVVTDNPWWNGRVDNPIDNVTRDYYVPSKGNDNINTVALDKFLLTMALRYYSNGAVPYTGKDIYQIDSIASFTETIYTKKSNECLEILRTSGTTQYPIKNLQIWGKKTSYSTSYLSISNKACSIFDTLTNVTIKNLGFTLNQNSFAKIITGGSITNMDIEATGVSNGAVAIEATNVAWSDIQCKLINGAIGLATVLYGGANSKIEKSSVTGTITNYASYNSCQFQAGIVGINYGDIAGCSSSADISSNEVSNFFYIGGLIGCNRGVIHNIDSNDNIMTGDITTTGTYVGGIVGCDEGYLNDVTYTQGNIITTGSNVGGVVGYLSNISSNCQIESGNYSRLYNVKFSGYSVSGIGQTGGFAGSSNYSTDTIDFERDEISISSGVKLSGAYSVGGIIGSMNNGTLDGGDTIIENITTSASKNGSIVGEIIDSTVCNFKFKNTTAKSGTYVGGAVGYSQGSSIIENITNDGWTITSFNTAGQSDYGIGGIIGYATNTTIENVTNNSNLIYDNYSHIGGIIGYSSSSNVKLQIDANESITVNSKIVGASYIGGIVGYGSVTSGSNITTFGDSFELHSKNSYVGMYRGSTSVLDKEVTNYTSGYYSYYYVHFENTIDNSTSITDDYAIINYTQTSYWLGTDSDKNYTYSEIGSNIEGKSGYWSAFNYTSLSSHEEVNVSGSTDGEKENIYEWYYHAVGTDRIIHLKKYNLRDVTFYGGEMDWFNGSTMGDCQITSTSGTNTSVKLLEGINYQWSWFYNYSLYTNLHKNENKIKVYSKNSLYDTNTSYDYYIYGDGDQNFYGTYKFVGMRYLLDPGSNSQNDYINNLYNKSAPRTEITVAINAMADGDNHLLYGGESANKPTYHAFTDSQNIGNYNHFAYLFVRSYSGASEDSVDNNNIDVGIHLLGRLRDYDKSGATYYPLRYNDKYKDITVDNYETYLNNSAWIDSQWGCSEKGTSNLTAVVQPTTIFSLRDSLSRMNCTVMGNSSQDQFEFIRCVKLNNGNGYLIKANVYDRGGDNKETIDNDNFMDSNGNTVDSTLVTYYDWVQYMAWCYISGDAAKFVNDSTSYYVIRIPYLIITFD